MVSVRSPLDVPLPLTHACYFFCGLFNTCALLTLNVLLERSPAKWVYSVEAVVNKGSPDSNWFAYGHAWRGEQHFTNKYTSYGGHMVANCILVFL